MKIGSIEIDLSPYFEKELVGKRFILAVILVVMFAYGYFSEGIIGAVIGYYFGNHTATE